MLKDVKASIRKRVRVSPMLAATAMFLVGAVNADAGQPYFMGLGCPLGGGDSAAYGVSADGSAVVGECAGRAFRWTRSDGMISLTTINRTVATGVSSDGTAAAGYAYFGDYRAFRWTQDGGAAYLENPQVWDSTFTGGISGDGSTVVGTGYRNNLNHPPEAFRWTQSTGVEGLGLVPGSVGSFALGTSADGSVVVGYAERDTNQSDVEAFRWTEADGMVGLGYLPTGVQSFARGVSADGSTVVGASFVPASGQQAFRWTQDQGMVGLGHLPAGIYNEASGVSADGSVIVGYEITAAAGDQAFRWTAGDGLRRLQDVLKDDFDIQPTGWKLTHATAVSMDGLTFVGYGFNPAGGQEAWVAHVPEPTTLGLIVSVAIILVRRQRL